MENKTPFDLNAAVQRWRAELAKSPNFRADDLDELESHVRDSEASLRALGLTSEEAFLIAVRRTGAGDVIAAEFATVNRSYVWQSRLLWMSAAWILSPLFLLPVRMLLVDARINPDPVALTPFLPSLTFAAVVWLQGNLVRKAFRAPLKLASILTFVILISVSLKMSLDDYWLAATVPLVVSAAGLGFFALPRRRRGPEFRHS